MTDWIDQFCAAARGLAVSHIWRGYGSALFVELGALTPRVLRDGKTGNPSGELGPMIEWSWRIEDARSILCGSFSDEVLWQPTFELLVGQQVIDVSTFGRLPELMLSLSGDFYISSFMTDVGDPSWTLFDRRKKPSVAVSCRAGMIVAELQ
jgi:hypothetical protein